MNFSRIMHRSIVTLAVLFSAISANAGAQSGQVSIIHIRGDGLIYFSLTGGTTISGSPACATHGYWIIKDENSNYGRQQLALLMTAKATGASITITGANTCTRWFDGEDVFEMQL